jgi:hypothetical protein
MIGPYFCAQYYDRIRIVSFDPGIQQIVRNENGFNHLLKIIDNDGGRDEGK